MRRRAIANLIATFDHNLGLTNEKKRSHNSQQTLKHTSHMTHNTYAYNVRSAFSEVLSPRLGLTHEKDSRLKVDSKI